MKCLIAGHSFLHHSVKVTLLPRKTNFIEGEAQWAKNSNVLYRGCFLFFSLFPLILSHSFLSLSVFCFFLTLSLFCLFLSTNMPTPVSTESGSLVCWPYACGFKKMLLYLTTMEASRRKPDNVHIKFETKFQSAFKIKIGILTHKISMILISI